MAVVDLPGYGYAAVPDSVRRKWGPLIQGYLKDRASLKLLLYLFDIRRLPSDEDRALLDWMIFHQKAIILVLTKVDKVTQTEKKNNTRKILEGFGVENLHYTYYSATKNVGQKELSGLIRDALQGEEEESDGTS